MNNVKNIVVKAANIFCLEEKSSPQVEKENVGCLIG